MLRLTYILVFALFLLAPTGSVRTSVEPMGTGVTSITIFNTHTHELESIQYKDAQSGYLTSGLKELNRITRCRLTGEEFEISPKLVELVANIQRHFHASRIDLISGYRSPKLNFSLRSSGHRVASRSLHMEGLAMDIRIPGVPLKAIRDYAKTLQAGGVGYYPGNFVHVDVGPVRYW